MYLLNETVLIRLVLLPLNQAVFTPWFGPAGWLLGYALYWVLLLGTSLLLHTCVEQPFMRLREGLDGQERRRPLTAGQEQMLPG